MEFVLELIDNLTGHKLDYGIGRLAGKLTRKIKNEKLKKVLRILIYAVLLLAICAVVVIVAFIIEAWRMGKI